MTAAAVATAAGCGDTDPSTVRLPVEQPDGVYAFPHEFHNCPPEFIYAGEKGLICFRR